MSDPSDEALLQAYRDGNTSAFETLLKRYRGPLFNFLLRSVRDRGRTEEIYQDVWMKVIERCDDFRGDAKFSTWLYAIARNRCIDHQRRMVFRRHQSLDAPESDGGRTLGERVPGGGIPIDREAMRGALRNRIGKAVEVLPDEQREVFLLRQLQGMSFKEIADLTGTSVNTAKSRMRYALERLQQSLSDLTTRTAGLESSKHDM